MFKFKLTKFHQNIESIGDGSLIQVMKDLWILGEGSAWVHSPQPLEVHNMAVNNLMIQGERRWYYSRPSADFFFNICCDY